MCKKIMDGRLNELDCIDCKYDNEGTEFKECETCVEYSNYKPII